MEKTEIKHNNPLQELLGQQRKHTIIHRQWWKEEDFTHKTQYYLAVLFIINNIIVVPVFFRELLSSFLSSGSLVLVANFFNIFGLDKHIFFILLTIFSLSIIPLSFYIFARKLFAKDELTAFVATLFFILPTLFTFGQPIFIHPLVHSDGSHIVAFVLVPLFLLYLQILLRRGVPLLSFFCSIAGACILIISPFAAFHTLFFGLILTIAEGFGGNFRLTLRRFLTVTLGSLFLAAFWYSTILMNNILFVTHLQYIAERVLSIAPVILPALFIICMTLFFVFNQIEGGKRPFIVFGFFLVELLFFGAASFLNLQGFFHPERFFIEFGFASSLFFAFGSGVIIKWYWHKKLTLVQRKQWQSKKGTIYILGGLLIGLFTILGLVLTWQYISQPVIPFTFDIGVGGIEQVIDFNDIFSLIVSFISMGTLVLLAYVITKYPGGEKN